MEKKDPQLPPLPPPIIIPIVPPGKGRIALWLVVVATAASSSSTTTTTTTGIIAFCNTCFARPLFPLASRNLLALSLSFSLGAFRVVSARRGRGRLRGGRLRGGRIWRGRVRIWIRGWVRRRNCGSTTSAITGTRETSILGVIAVLAYLGLDPTCCICNVCVYALKNK